ncbi:VanZ family protein [Bacillus sp. DTU_2020_1000418_1_SI_GHA_SEK_038]|uniref:VanZ family protein n=1 Tax=Bacillus sp. DTU_2020_1000418_1_SI_GHA_SEK_038 TaxID=3077585 RepID=UPI0028EED862|nr:VanZ family protein [Bacillus sp. DTU_2020_1000418_1_SI_GHA_SEK_038]WNS77509.1 VanZ family protein [Bacillus sp. DTU_2020_1000418_1_SI_GHA_SEK_038]
MKKKHVWLTVAIVYCIAIFITTASPASTGGNTLMIIAEIFHLSEEQARMANLLFRKLVHLSAFGVLAILFYNSFEKHRFIKAWLYTTIYAASDEIHQAFLPDRTGSIVDVGIDSFGALIALIIIKMATLRRR